MKELNVENIKKEMQYSALNRILELLEYGFDEQEDGTVYDSLTGFDMYTRDIDECNYILKEYGKENALDIVGRQFSWDDPAFNDDEELICFIDTLYSSVAKELFEEIISNENDFIKHIWESGICESNSEILYNLFALALENLDFEL